MTSLQLSVEFDAPRSDISFIHEGLMDYNHKIVGDRSITSLAVFLRNASGAVVGGLVADVYWRWLNIEAMWMADEHRRAGYGTQLLSIAEIEAKKRNCTDSRLDTFSFQALPFYQKNGYQVFGELVDMPLGFTRYFLCKKL